MPKISLLYIGLFILTTIKCQATGSKLQGTQISSDKFTGYQFKAPVMVTSINFPSDPSSYFLGIFQGANEESFIDAIPIYIFTKETSEKSITIKTTQSFKYIRFVPPSGKPKVSDFEVYGEEKESTEGYGFFQPTNLPLLVINTANSKELPANDKETTLECNMVVIKDGKKNAEGKGNVKHRGNSTLNAAKKSYRSKFDEKTQLLSLPAKAKKWVLFANHYDKTLLRNRVGFKLSSLFGMKYTPQCEYVDLILNGDFKGNYLLCDQIQVGKGRVELTELDSSSNSEPEISGGYLIEGDAFAEKEPSYFKTTKDILFAIKYPSADDITPQQKEYIQKKFDAVINEIYSDKLDSLDLESFSKYFLVQEFGANIDSIWSSFYLTKERGDDKIYVGPVWDMDLAFDNDIFLYPTNKKDNFAFKYQYSNGGMQDLVMKILSNEDCLGKIKKQWDHLTNNVFSKEDLLLFIDEQVKYLDESQKLNFKRWDVLSKKEFLQPDARGSYEKEVNYLKDFISERMKVFTDILKSANKESVNAEVQGGWNNGGGMGGMGGMWGGGQGGWPGQGGQGGWGGWGGFGGNGGN